MWELQDLLGASLKPQPSFESFDFGMSFVHVPNFDARRGGDRVPRGVRRAVELRYLEAPRSVQVDDAAQSMGSVYFMFFLWTTDG